MMREIKNHTHLDNMARQGTPRWKSPADMLREIGCFLYGRISIPVLAYVLDVRQDTVRHWLSGKNKIPLSVFDDLLKLPTISCDDEARRYLAAWIEQQRRDGEPK